MDRQIYWNQFETSKHHFIKVMNNFRSELRVPKKFVMRFPLRLGVAVKLIGPIGDVQRVRVVETEEDVVFMEGWGQFVDDHQLNEKDLAVFHYTGNMVFEVLLFDRTGCVKDLRMIHDQLEIKPHFFKKMNKESRSELVIPQKLVRTFSKIFSGTINLKGPSGNVWKVGAERTGEDVILRKGWSEFVSDHSLGEIELLVFHYMGDSSFSILIFDRTACEKESAHFVKPRVESADPPNCQNAKTKGKRPPSSQVTNEIRGKEKGKLCTQKLDAKMRTAEKNNIDANQTPRLPTVISQEELHDLKLRHSQKKASNKTYS